MDKLFSLDELQDIIEGKQLYVWTIGHIAQQLADTMRENERLRNALLESNEGFLWLREHISQMYSQVRWDNTSAINRIDEQVVDNNTALNRNKESVMQASTQFNEFSQHKLSTKTTDDA